MSRRTTRLPDDLYSVRVPTVCTYTPEELEVYGLPVAENTEGVKFDISTEMSQVMLPLSKIIDIYMMGAPIRLTDPDQIDTLYKILDDYVRGNGTGIVMLNATSYIEERELEIDKFASEIFNINRTDIVNKMVNVKSGFDIGIKKMAPHSGFASQGLNNDRRPSYLTTDVSHIDPAKVKRPERVRRRRRTIIKE